MCGGQLKITGERSEMRKKNPNPVFYVYALLDPSYPGSFQYRESQVFEYEPFYIGKGQKFRFDDHFGHINCKNSNLFVAKKIRKIYRETGLKYKIKIIQETLFEQQAFELEIFLIKQIGRRDQNRGPLCNLTDGGEGSSGCKFSLESRQKCSASQLNRFLNPEERRKIRDSSIKSQNLPEVRKKNSEKQKQRYTDIREREKTSRSVIEAQSCPEIREKMRTSRLRFYRNPKNLEKCKAINIQLGLDSNIQRKKSDSHKKLWENSEYREKILSARRTPEYRLNLSFCSSNRERRKRGQSEFKNIEDWIASKTDLDRSKLEQRLNVGNLTDVVNKIKQGI